MARKRRQRIGFTLVELLVVIGIIAVLVGVLLPALSSARKRAATVKCSAALKDLGNAMLMYAHDNKGYLPAPRVNYGSPPRPYNVGGIMFHTSLPEVPGKSVSDAARWWNLLAKYVMKGEGIAQTADQMNQHIQRTVLWGCPAFDGFVVAGDPNISLQGDVNRNYPPYSMNCWPTFTPSYPPVGGSPDFPSPNDDWRFEGSNRGKWYKLTQYTRPSERALLGDSRGLLLEARAPAADGTFDGQPLLQNQSVYTSGGKQSSFDFYRHGKYPPVLNAQQFSPNGGKVSYNILYADMHAETAVARDTGYRALRMRYPG
jgi:prepilin-type N-terminal cleavage/methylation domain-containing protein